MSAKLVHQGGGDPRDVRGGQGDGQQPGRDFTGLIGSVHAEAERFALIVELLLPGLAPYRIGGEFTGGDVDLLGDEIQCRLREDLARPEQAARISKGTELQGIAKPVATPTASRDGDQIRLVQGPVTDEVGFRPRQGEETFQLRIGEQAASGHGRLSQSG